MYPKGHMAKTDNPLKRLVTIAAKDVAAWLLNSPVREVTTQASNLLLPAQAVDSDLVLFVLREDGRKVILHLEFQGPGSKRPMPRRMLEYRIRLNATYPNMPVISVVWYVGNTGADDTGEHHEVDEDGHVDLTWRYRVIHLWNMDGEALLALNRPALAALIGQTRLRDPEPALRQAVQQIVTGTSGRLQELLLIELLTLCTDEEVAAMAEQIVQYDSCGMPESPIIRKWREEGQLTLLLRQLVRRYGPLSTETRDRVASLTTPQMLDLAEALLDFTSRDDLEQWLAQQGEQKQEFLSP
ncbi:MAG: DUF4351 domain-containing protein [Candidatus Viridilinea halotolerans]|uniref:DUF4351 domain-containing protein n=1 Tax=Candidatus Viridilinea halotolerans TaxID=2491704 RepID=A0A426TZR5_9CHLR|nr:MAG: DUF4351 domain-containing protein [Candidatus Viridilinea halotolerans]